jgi:FKBP-type peptidyl-prolyl cis-trans isomerase
MHKSIVIVPQLLAATLMLLGVSTAQQTPASTTTQPSSTQSAAPAAKPSSGQTGAAKTPSTAAKKAATTAAPLVLKTDRQRQSYAMGMNIGVNLHRQGITLDPALVARGIKDSQAGGKTAMTEDEARAAIQQLQGEVRSKLEAKSKEEGAANVKTGEDFLAANKSKPGIVTLPSGLQYKILKEGTGPKPTASDTVKCNYRGTLINGKEFDSTAKHGGEPAEFPVGGVIKGWTEALQLMPVGSKWQLFIPPDMAYGARGAGADIGPNETLIFEVELLSIEPPKK